MPSRLFRTVCEIFNVPQKSCETVIAFAKPCYKGNTFSSVINYKRRWVLLRPGNWPRQFPCGRPVALSTEPASHRLIRSFDCSFQATETHSWGKIRFLSFDFIFKPFYLRSLLLHCIFMLFLELNCPKAIIGTFFFGPLVFCFANLFQLTSLRELSLLPCS